MKCGNCGEEMSPYGDPQISAAPVLVTGEKAPTKLVCSIMNIYSCAKCPVRAVYTDTVDYLPNIKVGECCVGEGCKCKGEDDEDYPIDGNYN